MYNSIDRKSCTESAMADRFPTFITSEADKAEMTFWCEAELNEWRRAVVAHYAIPTIEGRQDNFKNKAAAYDRLRRAYFAALEYALVQDEECQCGQCAA